MRHSFLALSLFLAPIAAASTDPLLVVLTETGQERDGLPVRAPHPDGERIAAQLDRGLSGEVIRAYRLLQIPKGAPATRMRLGFPLWYSNDERVLRHFAVKRNEFSREPSIPERLLVRRDHIDAYHVAALPAAILSTAWFS